MDALTSFVHLTDHLPEWIREITNLSTHASNKHSEFVADYSRILKGARPRRQKTSSIHSLHTNDDKTTEIPQIEMLHPEAVTSRPNLNEISPLEPGNQYLYAQARRKRKSRTSLQSGASGPQKFRNKQMVVIFYDSFLQEHLDGLVKSIGAARNNIRKGKMSRTLQRGLQLPKLDKRIENMYTPASIENLKTSSRSTKSLPLETRIAKTQIESVDHVAFLQTDKDLEIAQTFCETAAHQFLRDGDCKLELDSALAKFLAVQKIALVTVEQLKAEENRKEAPNLFEDEVQTDSETTLCEKTSMEVISAKIGPSLNEMLDSAPRFHGDNEIEVDDDSEASSILVDISKFRNARAVSASLRA